MRLQNFYVPICESTITVQQFKAYLENPVGFESDLDFLQDDIRAAGGLVRFVIRGNRWIKSLTFPLTVYRGLTVADPEKWVREHTRDVGRDLGVYWTDEFPIALNQNGPDGTFSRGGETNLVLSATVGDEDINWCTTVAMRSVDQEEPEIRLLKGATIMVTEALIVDTTTPHQADADAPHYNFDKRHIVKSLPMNLTLKV